MKKILGLLSTITITNSVIPKVIAFKPYNKLENNNKINYLQKNNLEKPNRHKRQSESWTFQTHVAGKTVYFNQLPSGKFIVDVNGANIEEVKSFSNFPSDSIYFDSKSNESSQEIKNTVYHKGGKFTFKWKWYKVFYWTLEMDHKACQVLSDYLNGIHGSAAGGGAGAFIASIGAASTLPGWLAAAITIIPALNLYLIYNLIQEKDSGNGIWIGFWLNQPGIGWGSL